jgi:hypothetical protein
MRLRPSRHAGSLPGVRDAFGKLRAGGRRVEPRGGRCGKRRLFNLAAAVSLVMMLAVVAMGPN